MKYEPDCFIIHSCECVHFLCKFGCLIAKNFHCSGPKKGICHLVNVRYKNTCIMHMYIIMTFLDRCIIPLPPSELGDNDLYIPRLRLGIYKTIVTSACGLGSLLHYYRPRCSAPRPIKIIISQIFVE